MPKPFAPAAKGFCVERGNFVLEVLRVVLPLAAALCFVWGAWRCAVGTLFPAITTATEPGGSPLEARELWRPALLCLAVGAAVQLLFVAWACGSGRYVTLLDALDAQFYGNTDARHYLDLAQYGYGAGEAFPEQYLMIVFFPLFPWLLRALHLLSGQDLRILALVIQLPLFCAAGTGLFALVRSRYGKATAWRALGLLLVSPAAVFFWAPMTESLFLALTVWYVWCLQRRCWARAALLGMLAGLTRAPGGLLAGLAFLELLRCWRAGERRPGAGALAAMAGPAVGLGLYFGLNQAVYGRWNQYSVYQWEHWGQKLGFFTGTIRYHLSYLVLWWQDNRPAALWICLTAVVCIVCSFALLAAAARRLPPSWLGYGLAYLLVTMGATWLLSAPRYAVALFCLPVAAAVLLQGHPRLTRLVGCLLLVGSVAYTLAYLMHQSIY